MKPIFFNSRPDHLLHIMSGEDACNLDDNLLDAHLFAIQMVDDYLADIVQFFSTGEASSDFIVAQKKQLVVKETKYQLIAGNLYKLGTDGILQRCVLENERNMVLPEAHERVAGVHYAGKETS